MQHNRFRIAYGNLLADAAGKAPEFSPIGIAAEREVRIDGKTV